MMIFQLTNVVLNKRNRFEDGGTKRKIHHQLLKLYHERRNIRIGLCHKYGIKPSKVDYHINMLVGGFEYDLYDFPISWECHDLN
jgi:hypothetical protein